MKVNGTQKELPVDCFHLHLLHHSQAENVNALFYRTIGIKLVNFWNISLKRDNFPGMFVYDEKNGFDVVYHA